MNFWHWKILLFDIWYRCELTVIPGKQTRFKRLQLSVCEINLQFSYKKDRTCNSKYFLLNFRLLLSPARSAEWRQSSHRRFSLNRYFQPRDFFPPLPFPFPLYSPEMRRCQSGLWLCDSDTSCLGLSAGFVFIVSSLQVVTAHAVRVPVTGNLSANITGFLPIHCIYQLLKSRSFTKHKVSIKVNLCFISVYNSGCWSGWLTGAEFLMNLVLSYHVI